MSQHDFNIANQGFPATRADLNNALQALASNSSGDAEPSTTFANQWWYETDTNTLKLRNEANNAWLSFATVDQSTAAWTLAHDVDITGTLTSDGLTVAGATSLTGNLTVDGGTIKLDGNYPVGANNVALGDAALASGSLSGGDNTAVGFQALTTNTSGEINTAVGSDALRYNTTGGHNTSLGVNALKQNTSGNYHTAVGKSALESNTTADSNNAFGRNALFTNTTGAQNVALGYLALYLNTTASYNTAVGNQALQNNTTGANNTSLGFLSLYANTTGSQNVALGTDALQQNTTADNNTAVGYQAGYSNTTGTNNVALGKDTLRNVDTTSNNTAVGNGAGYTTTGEYNTFLGRSSGGNITTGSKNTIIGSYNGNQGGLDIRTSDNNIVLSDGDGNPLMHYSGNNMQNVSTSHLRIYNKTNNTTAVSFRTAGVQRGYIQVTDSSVAYNTSSDYRLKENVVYDWDATTRLKQLKPARFNFIVDADTTVDGFLAHEAQEIVPECVTGAKDAVDADGVAVMQGIDQSKLVPLLVKTIQELEARITALEGN